MKEIDESIRGALRDAAMEYGSVLRLSRMLGVAHSTVLFWSSGRTRRIDGDVWRYKVYPLLEEHLRKRGVRIAHSHAMRREAPGTGTGLREVPVMGLLQVAGFDPAIESFDAYARSRSKDTALFATEPDKGCFALRVEGRGLEPEFPEGALLLVAGGEFAEDGDIAVARIRENGQIVVKRHSRMGAKMRLEPLNGQGASYEWDKGAGRGFLEWMHPVVEAKVDLRVRRHQGFAMETTSGFNTPDALRDYTPDEREV